MTIIHFLIDNHCLLKYYRQPDPLINVVKSVLLHSYDFTNKLHPSGVNILLLHYINIVFVLVLIHTPLDSFLLCFFV